MYKISRSSLNSKYNYGFFLKNKHDFGSETQLLIPTDPPTKPTEPLVSVAVKPVISSNMHYHGSHCRTLRLLCKSQVL